MKILIFLFALIFSAKAITITCDFWMSSHTNIQGNIYNCDAVASNFHNETLTAVGGAHQTGKSNADVKRIEFYNQQSLTFFPKGIQKFFPNLTVICFLSTNLLTLNGDELEPFGKLLTLHINDNKNLERIPGNLFCNNPLIHTVILNTNKIKYVGENLFDGHENLIHLDFRSNYCVNKYGSNNTALVTSLIQHLKTNCTDIDETPSICPSATTTTTPTTTTPTTIPTTKTTTTTPTTTPTTTTTTTTTTLATSTEGSHCGDFGDVVCDLQEQNQILIEKVEILSTDNEELKLELAEIKQKLDEVLLGILELSTRPCGK